MSAPGPALVTGAGGFVGGHLCAALAAAGVPVRALVRSPGAVFAPGVAPAAVRGLDDRAGVRRALEGVDAVFHLAARVHVMRERAADPLAEFRRVNVEGTRVLAEEAARAGVRVLVLASSVKAVGEGGPAALDERTPPAPADPYGVSKLEAERLVRGVGAGRGMRTPVLRLPLVYGAGMKGNLLALFRLVDRGVPLPLGGVRNRRSLLYAGNAVAAFRALADADAAGSGVYYASDGHDLSTPELVRAVARALGRPARLLPVSPALFRAVGRAGDALAAVAPFPLTSAAVGRLLGSLWVDPAGLVRATGFRPPFTVDEGMARTARWYRGR